MERVAPCWPVAFPPPAAGGGVANPDLARETADLLSIADKSSSRSLGELAALASRRGSPRSRPTPTPSRGGAAPIMAPTPPDPSHLSQVAAPPRARPATHP